MNVFNYVVVDWDWEEIVGATNTESHAKALKHMYCNTKGIAPDNDCDEPRFRVTVEKLGEK